MEAKKIRGPQDLPSTFIPTDDQESGPQPMPGVRLHLATPKKVTHWIGQGLVPVYRGSGLVKDDHLYQVTADGVLRWGNQLVMAETDAHRDLRKAHRAKILREEQKDLKQAREELRDTAAASKGNVTLHEDYNGGTQITEGPIDEGLAEEIKKALEKKASESESK